MSFRKQSFELEIFLNEQMIAIQYHVPFIIPLNSNIIDKKAYKFDIDDIDNHLCLLFIKAMQKNAVFSFYSSISQE